ncbi:MAG: carbohydrate kinase [Pseudomonadota bacterium]
MIAVGGENLIDFVQAAGEGLPSYIANPGGSPYNCAIALARQGVETGYMTPVSTDALGGLLTGRLEADGVTLLAERSEKPTSLAVVSLEDGIPTYAFHRSGTAERQVDAEMLERITPDAMEVFHVGGLAVADGADADAWQAYFSVCAARGICTSLDPNVRASLISDRDAYMARMEWLLADARVLKLSDEDLLWMYPEAELDAAIEVLRGKTQAALVVVTLGPEGAIGFAGGHRVAIPAAPVEPLIDTVGAGDTFMATLLAQIARDGMLSAEALGEMSDEALESLLSKASKAAAINCTRSGCNPPYLSEL